MVKKIALGLVSVIVVAVVAICGIAATKPDSFRVERSVSVHASADKVAPLLTDFHAWAAWSPWEKLDPSMKRTYSGAATGVGAVYEWSGSDQVGAGRMEVTEASATHVAIKLDFLKPFEGHNVAEFSLAPAGDATSVTWAMHGPSPFASKVMGVFMSMDSLIGKDFERGLADLKAAAEK